MGEFSLRAWQKEALGLWKGAGNKGIVEVVTGAGKTIFALSCIREIGAETTLVIVPTVALLDQWWEEAASFSGYRWRTSILSPLREGYAPERLILPS